MSAISVSGTINNPDPIYSYEEPPTSFIGATIAGGVTTELSIQGFKNSGNVPQQLTVAVTNPTGVTVQNYTLEVGDTFIGTSAMLNPGQRAILHVTVQTPDVGIAEDTSYGFELDTSWTH